MSGTGSTIPATVAPSPRPQDFRPGWLAGLTDRQRIYRQSIDQPETFWARMAQEFHWDKKWHTVRDYNYDYRKGPVYQRWFDGGKTNMCYNCLDRHLLEHGERVAFFWEGNDPKESMQITYRELHEEVCRFANVLKNVMKVKKGDRVAIYMPMVVQGPAAMLACARIGAVSTVVFAGFSAASLAQRLVDSQATVLFTADAMMRGDKKIELKQIVDEALGIANDAGLKVRSIVYDRLGRKCAMTPERDVWYQDLISEQHSECDIEWLDAEDPLFMLYTSGSTGKPKGMLHTTGGYMVFAGLTFRYAFDHQPNDIYFCTADIGWITGHTYITYGPMLNGASQVLYEGVPVYPDASRWWRIVDKHRVTIFYTAPTAIRSLIGAGNEPVMATSRRSLRVLGSVGEPINRDAWNWYYTVVGDRRCDIVDTWWQTETGGIMLTPMPHSTPLKPGCASLPMFGVEPALVDEDGRELKGKAAGYLVVKQPWPGQARTIYNNHARYENTYFMGDGRKHFAGYYFTGDGARRDADGYIWVTGRVDDVINVSGHRLGSGEIENAINSHSQVNESAVVSMPHKIKGEGIYAFVTFKKGTTVTPDLLTAVKQKVRKVVGPIATPDVLHPATGLPKTRSGKIMRRVLRQIALGESDPASKKFGDTTTLADPSVVVSLIESRPGTNSAPKL